MLPATLVLALHFGNSPYKYKYVLHMIRDKWTRVVCASGSGTQKIDTSVLSIATIVFVKEHRVLRTGRVLEKIPG